MKKKSLVLLVTVALIATMMTACGETKGPDSESVNSEATSSEKNSETTDSEGASSETNSETPSPESTEDSTVSGDASSETTPEGNEPGMEDVAAVPSNDTIDVIFAAVRTKLDTNYFPNMPIEALFLKDMYGIDLSNVEAAYGEMPMISATVDTFIAVKAVSGQADAVKANLEAYLKSQQENAFQYPINIPVVQNAEVYVKGDYVFYICLAGDTMDAAEKGDEAIGEQAKNTVASVKTIIDENVK